jgi:phenylacetate-CoA ligase
MRKVIEEVFQVPLYDKYGTIETLLIAAECSQSKEEHYLHVFSDIKHIDILDENMKSVPDGQEGFTVLTSFHNRVAPVIKYWVGDRTHYLTKDCSCGLPFPCIAPIKGRMNDTIRSKDGIDITPISLHHIFDKYPESVEVFQYVQDRDYSVTLKVKPNKNVRNYREYIVESFEVFRQLHTGRIDISLEITDDLKPVNGKYVIVVHG